MTTPLLCSSPFYSPFSIPTLLSISLSPPLPLSPTSATSLTSPNISPSPKPPLPISLTLTSLIYPFIKIAKATNKIVNNTIATNKDFLLRLFFAEDEDEEKRTQQLLWSVEVC